eukprot:COSAG06_NODE_3546_length_5201_cov_21.568013_1_plen_491_part_10
MASLAFERAHADLEQSEGNAVVTVTEEDGSARTAASGAVLKGGGRHMVQLTVLRKGEDMYFGLIRADWDVEGGKDAQAVQGHCFYYTYFGQRYPGVSDWEGMQTAREEGDRIGLLLDLDAGSLTVYKNDAWLGVMQESGLTDAAGYRWAVVLYYKGFSARIDAVPVAAREEDQLLGAFERAHADFERSEGNAVVTKTTESDGYSRTAASGAVLKGGGRHMVQLTVRKGDDMMFGLIRADWGVEGGESARDVQGHCFYYTYDGRRYPGGSDWEGRQTANEEGDRIGLLLDLDAGSLTVYKNDERLGVMQESGLTDAAGYRWAVALYVKGSSARIEGPLPVAAREEDQESLLRAWHAAMQDLALPAGTRLRVEGLGDGVYERWERKTFGANAHFIDFGGGVQRVALRSLAPSQWSVLPPLATPVVTVRALEMTGGEAVEVAGVSLDWSVSQLNAAIAERRGRSAELQRLVLGGVALDDEDALLSSCGVVDGTE